MSVVTLTLTLKVLTILLLIKIIRQTVRCSSNNAIVAVVVLRIRTFNVAEVRGQNARFMFLVSIVLAGLLYCSRYMTNLLLLLTVGSCFTA